MNAKIDIRRNFIRLAILCLALAAPAIQANASCTYPPAQASLRKAFPGWQIVDIKNLRQDDRALWIKQHSAECPGFVQGHFQSNTKQTYAMTVFKGSNDSLQQMLLIANSSNGKYKISVLNGPQKVAYLSVISKLPPGEYPDTDGEKLKVGSESILYEAIEAGSILYYFQNGRYKSETISE